MRKHLWLLLLFSFLASGTPAAGADDSASAVAVEDAAERLMEDDDEDVIFADLARRFRKHCVQVSLYGRPSDGQRPATSSLEEDMRHERPTLFGGYWWDDRHVVIPDPVIQDRFVGYIEVRLPGEETVYPARIAGRFVKLQALLLEVDADEKGVHPEAHPLEFIDGDLDEALMFAYEWDEGEWRVVAKTGMGTSALGDDGVETVSLTEEGVLISHRGDALGLAFGDKVVFNDDEPYWMGRELHYARIISREEAAADREAMRRRLANAVLETRFRIRVKVDDDDDEENAMWALDLDENRAPAGKSEVRAAGLVVGKRHLLVPAPLASDGILRIEAITVVTPSGQELEAEFVGALREYMAVLIEVKQNLPNRNLPNGFGLLNPLAGPGVPDGLIRQNAPLMEYFQRWRIDYLLGRRREVSDYDRWIGTFRGYRGDPVVMTRTNEGDGSLAFDTEGNLAAIALTPRLIKSRDPNLDLNQEASPGFRPLDFIVKKLTADDVFDPYLMPVDEEQGQRLVDFGVEIQSLDVNTAQLFHVTRESRGGRIGVLVTHVYPGSTAAGIGIREHDVLLRILIEGRAEPMELRSSNYAFQGVFDAGDMASESFQSMLRYMPPPWPSRDNVVSTLLTSAGPGRKAVIEYMREGELLKADFVTGYFEPDYRNARKDRYQALGLTVKPITFEVARYFGRPDQSGVIVSKVEVGGKGSVAGLHHYLLITHVDGRPVAGADDFRDKVTAFEAGEAKSIELTVEGFGKTRLVKIE